MVAARVCSRLGHSARFMTDVLADLPRFVADSEPWFRETLATLVEQPTVSLGKTDDAAILAGVEVGAEVLRRAGAKVEVVPTAGTPALLARFAHPQPRARVVVYNHFDVQPADADKWQQDDPFRLEVRRDREREFVYFGRGTTDDKGPALCALRAAEWVARHELPIEIICLWETEEEIGSPNLDDALRARCELLSGDCVIVSDTIWPAAGHPVISTGLRGALLAVLRLRSAAQQSHSRLPGSVARNPSRELANLAMAIETAEFWQLDAELASAEQIEGFSRTGCDPHDSRGAHEPDTLETEVPLERGPEASARPAFEVHGLTRGDSGAGIERTVAGEAELKLSFRLVPGQTPARLLARLEAFVRSLNRDVVVEPIASFAPYRGPIRGRVHEAIARGMEQGFGKVPALAHEGGAIAAVPKMAGLLGVPVHFLPLSLPEHGYHAPNEYFDWRQARGGIAAFVHTFAALAS